ncbi:UxaA family hydrolase [bacterium]|nr:UxaA family hydrolase [bacterium]
MHDENAHIALVLDSADNVATMLEDCIPGDVIRLKGNGKTLVTVDSIPAGHKIAVSPVPAGHGIIKYGQKIGISTGIIQPGEWVHLHNMKSAYDEDFKQRIEQ